MTMWLSLAVAESGRLHDKTNLTEAELHQLLEWQRLGFSVREAVDLTFMPVEDVLGHDADYDLNPVRRARELELV